MSADEFRDYVSSRGNEPFPGVFFDIDEDRRRSEFCIILRDPAGSPLSIRRYTYLEMAPLLRAAVYNEMVDEARAKIP